MTEAPGRLDATPAEAEQLDAASRRNMEVLGYG